MAYINGNKSVSVVKTQSVAVDVEANPTGTATETLEKLKVDNTIYSVDGGASSPDSAMSDSSVNAVQNKVIKKYVDDKADTKANTDGYYSTMGVGHSDSALSLDSSVGNDDQTPFNYQTAGGDSDITTGIQSLKKLVGASVVFNQLIKNGNFESNSYWSATSGTFSIANNKATITSNTSSSSFNLNQSFTIIENHKYLQIATIKIISATNTPSRIYGSNNGNWSYVFGVQESPATNTEYKWSRISNLSPSASMLLFICEKANASDEVVFELSNVIIIDLTQMFGSQVADYIYAKEQTNAGDGVAIFKSMFPNDYYAYNTGTFIHSQSAKLKIVDYNQWDEQCKNGTSIDTDTGQEITSAGTTGYSISKNKIQILPNTQYYATSLNNKQVVFYYYDINDNYLGFVVATNSAKTTPVNAYWLKIRISENPYANDICISLYWDGSRIGYEPYQEHIYDLPNDELKGILKVVDNKIVADGDEEYPDGDKKENYDVGNLGTATWNDSGMSGLFFTNDFASVIKKPTNQSVGNEIRNMIMTDGKYKISNMDGLPKQSGYWYAVSATGRVYIENHDCSTTSELATALNGVSLLYPLQTPTETTSTAFAENIYVDDFGTMEFLDENNARITGIQGNEIFYKANISGFAESLYVKTDGDVDDIVTEEDINDTALATRGYIKLTSITGYDATKTQVLKNVNGTFTWVDET